AWGRGVPRDLAACAPRDADQPNGRTPDRIGAEGKVDRATANGLAFFPRQSSIRVERDLRARCQIVRPAAAGRQSLASSSPPSLATACQGSGRSTLARPAGGQTRRFEVGDFANTCGKRRAVRACPETPESYSRTPQRGIPTLKQNARG